ncbi:MAG: carboxysome shell protein, partial [Synechococcaceae bacterium WB6_3A_227]|nr:carboxysome shell protein [Synechococcaceae bacterium WB6_3A_227]
IQSPARSAQAQREKVGAVTGSTYEQGGRITGPFDMASGKVTGTEQFRFDRSPSAAVVQSAPAEPGQEPVSRVTGSSGNTDKGSLITVSGGARG